LPKGKSVFFTLLWNVQLLKNPHYSIIQLTEKKENDK
jgi:hypothetical protein